jgi:hypothetical protein
VQRDPGRTRKPQLRPLRKRLIFVILYLLRAYAHVDTIVLQVKLAYMDDRRSILLRDEMEKERRAARDLAAAKQAATQDLSPSRSTTPEIAIDSE